MRHLLAFVLMIALVGSVAAADLGNVQKDTKNNDHVFMNPGTPDRQGGEDIASAAPIGAIPFNSAGSTNGYADNYDEICPYGPATSPDVVYSYAAGADMVVSMDLCGSSYDTKAFIYDSAMNVVGCNDDFYFDDACGVYVSFIEEAYLVAGETYYFVVDGYGGDFGDYLLEIVEVIPDPPCVIDCDTDDEGEPEIADGYMDDFNGGCNSPEFGEPFSEFTADANGDLTFCGQAAWYITADGGNSRDTDWYIATIGEAGIVEWTLDAEFESYGFLLGPNDCASVGVVDQMLVGPCNPLTMVVQGAPGDIVWLWVGSSTFAGPMGSQEYPYLCNFTGLEAGETVATEGISFDGIKSLYR